MSAINLKDAWAGRSGLVDYPRTFPGAEFARNSSPSRDVEGLEQRE